MVRTLPLSIFFFGLSLSLGVVSHAADAKRVAAVVTIDQPAFDGRLTRIRDDGSLQFTDADGRTHDIPPERLVRWGGAMDTSKGPQALLVDGSLLVADPIGEPLAIEEDAVRFEVDIFDTGRIERRLVTLPLELVRGVVFRVPNEVQQRDRMLAMLNDPKRRSDVVFLQNGDRLEGTITALTESDVLIKVADQESTIDMARVTAVAFNSALARRPRDLDKRVVVSTADGSRFLATKLVGGTSETQIHLPGSKSISVTPERIVGVQPLSTPVTYLSNLKATNFRHIPMLDLAWPYHRDRNVLGDQLRSGGRVYHKGLGLHSTARLTYRLPGLYQRLEADLAIDDATAGAGSVTFRVLVDDGSGKRKTVYRSPVVRGGDKPLPMSADVTGAKRISLVVDFAERGDVQDHANWLDARLVP